MTSTSPPPPPPPPLPAASVDLDDVQGLLRFGYARHTQACFLLLRIRDVRAARDWLAAAPVASARTVDVPPPTVLQVALTSPGLRALGVADDIVDAFSAEFVAGMSGDAARARRLGDVGANDPGGWQWGASPAVPHVLLLLYALPGHLDAWQRTICAQCEAGFEQIACLSTSDMDGVEPFGFVDGISQPRVDWERTRAPHDATQPDYINRACLGEFLLGYPNEYGGYTDRPLLDPQRDPAATLARAEDAPGRADLGRNGSYLVLRQLRQDVAGFWQFMDRQAGGDPVARQQLAESMVGRTMRGDPLVDGSDAGATPPEGASGKAAQAEQNAFTFDTDPHGLRCPLGAHIRRSNPRNADLPPGAPGVVSRVLRTLGFDADALANDLVASTRFHRLLRRGREYGAQLSAQRALAGPAAAADTGLHFICLGANIARQFEFVQSAWLMGTKFGGLSGEGDPLLGNRAPDVNRIPSDQFSMPQAAGADRRVAGMPQFVTVLGGAYFFLPGIRALRYLASTAAAATTAAKRSSVATMNSNTSRPTPRADTGSAALNAVSDALGALVRLERRIDPFVRPAFDAVLRDPVARLVTALINAQRPNEGLKIAEERPALDEAAQLDSIITSFNTQMRKLWKPGGFERGGNTKTHGMVRGEFSVHEGLPAAFRHGIYAQPRSFRAWVRFSGPGPYVTPDIDDVGFMSISIKLLGVAGPKLMDQEKFTQDMTAVSTPTFVTPDTRANAQLQIASVKNAQIFHFINFHRPHLLDLIMQSLWTKTQSSPFEAPYFSCVPYLLGAGQAMQFSIWPKSTRRTPIPRLPRRPPDDYLRNAMVASLAAGDVEFDIRLQLQTDAHRMPIENNGVLWPERLSPRVSVATLRLPRQTFASQAQIDFARRLSYNPWHSIAEHRPLGNQSRARRRMYAELSALRQTMNAVPHYEPSGDEVFDP